MVKLRIPRASAKPAEPAAAPTVGEYPETDVQYRLRRLLPSADSDRFWSEADRDRLRLVKEQALQHQANFQPSYHAHRHADHISGFTNEKRASVEVSVIWMPWIESNGSGGKKALEETEERAKALHLLSRDRLI